MHLCECVFHCFFFLKFWSLFYNLFSDSRSFFNHSCRVSLLVTNYFSMLLSQDVLIGTQLLEDILLHIDFRLGCYCLSAPKNIMPLCLGLHGFRCEMHWHSYCFSYESKVSFLSCCSWDLFFVYFVGPWH